MTAQTLRSSSWIWLLFLFTLAGSSQTMSFPQMTAFTPLYLPDRGLRLAEMAIWTGVIAAISNAVGIPLLPVWGTLADRYACQPIVVRSFVAHTRGPSLTACPPVFSPFRSPPWRVRRPTKCGGG
jgi:MFS family permease